MSEAQLPDEAAIDEAVRVLRRGGLVAIPTETVYGLGADAANEEAVRRIFHVKGRPADHPLIVHLASARELDRWAVEIPATAHLLARAFWPGPLSLVLWRAEHVLDAVTGGQDTVALRVPSHPATLAVLERLGSGIAAPSANRFGKVSPTTAHDVAEDLGGDVDFVLDGGPAHVGLESTILDLTGEHPTLLRPGGVSIEAIEAVLGTTVTRTTRGRTRAPGMLKAHYAPRARVVLTDREAVSRDALTARAAGQRVGVLAMQGHATLPDGVVDLDLGREPATSARLLYGRLREADRLGLDLVLAIPPEESGLGAAIVDRLRRAAAAHGAG
ncbi:MAG: L-threonylcarbamoyladenylate synthase [Polyangiales bacterium]